MIILPFLICDAITFLHDGIIALFDKCRFLMAYSDRASTGPGPGIMAPGILY